MIRRFYVHNFRCLENFDLPIAGRSSILLIGRNGAGKTTISAALEVLQKIARGTNQVGELVKPKDLSRGRSDVPMRFELEVDVEGRLYAYVIALEFPKGFKELRVLEEVLSVDGSVIYNRDSAKVHIAKTRTEKEAHFFIDWHLVALPIVQQSREEDTLSAFKTWLSRILILGPVPSLIQGDSEKEVLHPNRQVTNFADWFSGLLAFAPSSYTVIDRYLKPLMEDLKDIKNPSVGTESRSLIVQFSTGKGNISIPLGDLSDGEKCFMICALVLAASEAYGPLLCFWDEPDNYLALSEVGHFVVALRRAFQQGGQFIATSHNPEAIRRFSEENTLVLQRRNHLDPTVVRWLAELHVPGDLINTLITGDIESYA